MADELESLVVKIQADVSELKQGFDDGAAAVGSGISKINSSIDTLVSHSESAGGAFHEAWHTALGVFEAEALLEGLHKLGEVVEETFHEIVVESINDAAAYETSLNRMNNALALAGEYSKESSQEMAEFAESVSKSSTYSGQAVLGASALIETLSKLDTEGLKKATQGAVELSSALAIDLDTAARLVGKAAEGNTDAFKRYGLEIEKGATASETFANVMRTIDGLSGSAANAVNTYSGALAQLHNASESSHEALGAIVVQNQAVIESIKAVTGIIDGNTEETKKNQQAYKELIGEGILIVIDGLAAMVSAFDAAARAGEIAFFGVRGAIEAVSLGIITLIDGPFALLYKGLSLLPGVGDEFAKKFDAIMANAAGVAASVNADAANIEKAINSPTAAGQKFEDQLLKIREAAATGLGAVRSGADAMIEPMNRATKATQELDDAESKLAEQGAKLAKQTLEQDDPSRKYAEQVKLLNAAHAQMKISDLDYAKANELLQDQMGDAFTKERKSEVEQLLKDNKELEALGASKNKEEIDENKARINELVAAEEQGSSLRIEVQKRYKDEADKIDKARLEAATSSLNELASFQSSKNAEMAQVGKLAAIAATTISTYEGAQKAATAVADIPYVGPALALAAAAAFIAGGLGRVAQIEGIGLEGGIDSVPGMGTKDNFPAMLAPGERVIPSDTNRDLKSFMAGQNPMVELLKGIHQQLGALHSTMANQKMVVQVGGKTIVDTLRSELRGGRSFAI